MTNAEFQSKVLTYLSRILASTLRTEANMEELMVSQQISQQQILDSLNAESAEVETLIDLVKTQSGTLDQVEQQLQQALDANKIDQAAAQAVMDKIAETRQHVNDQIGSMTGGGGNDTLGGGNGSDTVQQP